MGTTIARQPEDLILYPDDDGEPMSDDTIQFRWIQTIVAGLQVLFRDRADVFVAGNLLWYVREGAADEKVAPDAMVVFGRPKGERGSYMQWREGGIAPQVVFEVRSPGNDDDEMERKFRFYDDRGVEEYYLFDPHAKRFQGWVRRDGRLVAVERAGGWVSPRLGIRFESRGPEGLTIRHPDGEAFGTAVEEWEGKLEERRRKLEERRLKVAERRRAEAAEARAEAERERAEAERERAETERERAERFKARLRELGESVDD